MACNGYKVLIELLCSRCIESYTDKQCESEEGGPTCTVMQDFKCASPTC
jgi:hypothetical protein